MPDDGDDGPEPLPELLRRLDLELPRRRGLQRAIDELGGLPPDDLPAPPLALRRRSRGAAIADARVPTSSSASSDDELDLGVREPPGWPTDQAADPVGGGPIGDLARRCRLLSVLRPQLRYVWDQRRRWVFDLAWPHARIAVAIDGGWRIGRRRVYGSGWIRDAEQINEAVIDGWSVLRVTVAKIKDGMALRLIARAFASPWKRV